MWSQGSLILQVIDKVFESRKLLLRPEAQGGEQRGEGNSQVQVCPDLGFAAQGAKTVTQPTLPCLFNVVPFQCGKLWLSNKLTSLQIYTASCLLTRFKHICLTNSLFHDLSAITLRPVVNFKTEISQVQEKQHNDFSFFGCRLGNPFSFFLPWRSP